MPWAVAGAAVGAVGSIAGGAMSSGATKAAAAESAAVQREGLKLQERLADRSRADLMPYADTGRNALLMTSDLSGVNGPDAAREAMGGFTASPGYQNALEGGVRAIDRSAAARGMLRSGNTLQAVETFGQGLASADFGSWYNRLADLSKGGQAAAAAGQQQASNVLSGQIGDANKGIAQTIASAGGQQASIYGNMASGITNAATNGLANYRYLQQVDAQQPRNALYDESMFSGAGTAAGGVENAGW